jgi:hypothetical protein
LIQRGQRVIPMPFLVVLLFWLTVLHVSFGLFAPRDGTVITVLLISALPSSRVGQDNGIPIRLRPG